MPLAIVVSLENELPDAQAIYLKAGNGKALARELERVDFAARKCKVEQLSSLLSENQAALIAQLQADGFDPTKMRLPPEQWFAAIEGLKTLRALIEHIGTNLNDFKKPNPILRDLRAAEALLTTAEASGIRFHFSKVVV